MLFTQANTRGLNLKDKILQFQIDNTCCLKFIESCEPELFRLSAHIAVRILNSSIQNPSRNDYFENETE